MEIGVLHPIWYIHTHDYDVYANDGQFNHQLATLLGFANIP
jgi:hypothetical protein